MPAAGPSLPGGARDLFTPGASQMNKTFLVINAAAALLITAAAGCHRSPSADPARQLEGEWNVIELNENGTPIPLTDGVKVTVTIKDKKYSRAQEGAGSAKNEGIS